MKRIGLAGMALLLLGTGCSVHLDPKIPRNVGTPREGTIGAGASVRGMPARVGWGTFTVFAIPVAPVSIGNGPGEQIVMTKVKQTLASSGYQVVDAGAASGDAPVLECDVKRFGFKNYTYFFPLVFTWGGVDLDMRLVSRQGQRLWERSYSGSNSNLIYSFDAAANRSMEEVLEKFGRDASSEEFFRACCSQPPRDVAAVE